MLKNNNSPWWMFVELLRVVFCISPICTFPPNLTSSFTKGRWIFPRFFALFNIWSNTISSIFCISSVTWVPLSLILLLKTWYLFPHFSTSVWSASPSLSIYCSTLTSPSQSPCVNNTTVLLHAFPPRARRWSSAAFRFLSVNDELALTTSRRQQIPLAEPETQSWRSCLLNSAVYGHSVVQPGVSMTSTFVSLSITVPLMRFWLSASCPSLPKMQLAEDVLPECLPPRRNTLTTEGNCTLSVKRKKKILTGYI